MTIRELAKITGAKKANIRLYERQGLFGSGRPENHSPGGYGEKDRKALNRVLVLRRLGFPADEIRQIFEGTRPFAEAVKKQAAALRQEGSDAEGILRVCAQLEQDGMTGFDEGRCLELIAREEKQGFPFADISHDSLFAKCVSFTDTCDKILAHDFSGRAGRWLGWVLAIVLGLCAVHGLAVQSFRHTGTFLQGFAQSFLTFAAIAVLLLPFYFLSKNHRKAAFRYTRVLMAVCIMFLAAVLILLLVLFLNQRLHFMF